MLNAKCSMFWANAEMTTFTSNENRVISNLVAHLFWKRGEMVAANVC
jgi:hypothetical protein